MSNVGILTHAGHGGMWMAYLVLCYAGWGRFGTRWEDGDSYGRTGDAPGLVEVW